VTERSSTGTLVIFCRRTISAITALGLSVSVHALAAAADVRPDRPSKGSNNAVPGPSVSTHPDPGVTHEGLPVSIANVRLEPASPLEASPSMTLKFAIANEGSTSVSDIILKIAIVEKPKSEHPEPARRVLVGPFTIRGGDVVLRAGYTMNYEMLMRNLSSECSCLAIVDVLSARTLPE
jgi:hypothetical protein